MCSVAKVSKAGHRQAQVEAVRVCLLFGHDGGAAAYSGANIEGTSLLHNVTAWRKLAHHHKS